MTSLVCSHLFHPLCIQAWLAKVISYLYFTQFIHHILFNVSANQSVYQENFSFNVT